MYPQKVKTKIQLSASKSHLSFGTTLSLTQNYLYFNKKMLEMCFPNVSHMHIIIAECRLDLHLSVNSGYTAMAWVKLWNRYRASLPQCS